MKKRKSPFYNGANKKENKTATWRRSKSVKVRRNSDFWNCVFSWGRRAHAKGQEGTNKCRSFTSFSNPTLVYIHLHPPDLSLNSPATFSYACYCWCHHIQQQSEPYWVLSADHTFMWAAMFSFSSISREPLISWCEVQTSSYLLKEYLMNESKNEVHVDLFIMGVSLYI